MSKEAELSVEIRADTAGLTQALGAVQAQLDQTGKRVDAAHGAFGQLWMQFTAGFTAASVLQRGISFITDALKDSIKEAADYEKGVVGLNAAFDLSGRNMPGMIDNLKAFADELQGLGLADDTAALKSAALLMQLTSLDQHGIQAATRGAIGLSSVFGMDLTSATEMVAKGLEGNYMALGRLIPAIRNATTEQDKHAAMMKVLGNLYETAVAQTDTYAGQVKKMGLEWGEIKKTFGEAVLSTGLLQNAMSGLNDLMKDMSSKTVEGAIDAQKRKWAADNEALDILEKVAVATGRNVGEVGKLIGTYQQSATQIMDWVKAGEWGEKGQKALAEEIKKHNAEVDAQGKGYSETGPKIAAHTDKIKTAITVENTWLGVSRDLSEVLFRLGVSAKEAGLKISDSFTPAARDLRIVLFNVGVSARDAGLEIVNTFLPAARDLSGAAKTMIPMPELKTQVDDFNNMWDGAFAHLSQAFGDTFQSFVETWSWDRLINGEINFKDFFADLWGNIKDSFFTLVGDLAAKFVTDFLEKIVIGKTTDAVASAGKSIIGGIGDVAGAGAKAVTGVATGVIDTIANVVSAVTGVLDLLKGPQKQTDVTYWLKLTKDLTQEMHDMMRDIVAIMVYEQGQGDDKWWFQKSIMEATAEAARYLERIAGQGGDSGTVTTNDYLRQISSNTGEALSYLDWLGKVIMGASSYATGGIAWRPQMAHVAENRPEIIGPLDDYLAGRPIGGIPQSGGAVTVYQTINAQTLDRNTIDRAAEYLTVAVKREMKRSGI